MVNIWTYVKEKYIYTHTHNYLNDEAHCCCLAFKAHYDSPQCILPILPPNTQLIPANHAKNIYGTFCSMILPCLRRRGPSHCAQRPQHLLTWALTVVRGAGQAAQPASILFLSAPYHGVSPI